MTNMTSSAPTSSHAFWQRFRDLGSLRRSSDRRVAAGVAEGISRHFDIDPIIVRVLFAALTFFAGAGVILYLALWLTVPLDNAAHSIVSGRLDRDPQAWTTAGLAIGGVFAAAAFLGSISWAIPHPFPFLVILLFLAFALVAFTRRRDGREGRDVQWSSTATSAPLAPPPPSPPPPYVDVPAAGESTKGETVDLDPRPGDDPAPETVATHAWWQRSDAPPPGPRLPPLVPYAPPPPPRRPRSHLFGLTMATISLVMGGLWIFDATSSYDLDPSVYPGTALAIIAVALLVGAWWGRSRGLIAMGVLASLLTAGAAFAGPGPYGDVVARPTLASQLQPTYKLGGGQLTLHLEQISDIQNVNGRSIAVNARFGHVVVIIPSSVAATVNATVDHGEVAGVVGENDFARGGEQVRMSPPSNGRPVLTITIHLRFGKIQIERAACPGAPRYAPGESTQPWNGEINVPAACN